MAGVLYVQTNIHACGTTHACIGFLLCLCDFSCVCTHRSQYRQEVEISEKSPSLAFNRLLKDIDFFFLLKTKSFVVFVAFRSCIFDALCFNELLELEIESIFSVLFRDGRTRSSHPPSEVKTT